MEPTCSLCQLPKASLKCGLCEKSVCKKCSNKLKAGAFAYCATPLPALSHSLYCGICFDDTVAPALENYEATVEKARFVNVFYKGQGEETRKMRRLEKPLKVDNCKERSEALLRLAFKAAESGFNCLLDVDITSEKVRTGSYQSTLWSGRGVPISVDEASLGPPSR
jgi:hypothetical protein